MFLRLSNAVDCVCMVHSVVIVDALRQMIDISTPCHHNYHRASAVLLTIVDKWRYPNALLQGSEAGECDPSRQCFH